MGYGVKLCDTELGSPLLTLRSIDKNSGVGDFPVDLIYTNPQRFILRTMRGPVAGLRACAKKPQKALKNKDLRLLLAQTLTLRAWDPQTGIEVLNLKDSAASFGLSPDLRWFFNGSAIREFPVGPAN